MNLIAEVCFYIISLSDDYVDRLGLIWLSQQLLILRVCICMLTTVKLLTIDFLHFLPEDSVPSVRNEMVLTWFQAMYCVLARQLLHLEIVRITLEDLASGTFVAETIAATTRIVGMLWGRRTNYHLRSIPLFTRCWSAIVAVFLLLCVLNQS